MDDGAPRLPQDVERLIFRAAASAAGNDVKGMAKLLLVAKRVCEWIRPILYQVFNSSTLSRFPDFRRDPGILGEVGKFAKHLSIGNSTTSEDLIRLLLSCPDIEDIAIWHGQFSLYYPALHLFHLPLKRLSANIKLGLECFDLRAPPFPDLTHLEVSSSEFRSWSEHPWALASLRSLTHLAINCAKQLLDVDIAKDILLRYPYLQVYVLRLNECQCRKCSAEERRFAEVDNDRLALVLFGEEYQRIMDWERGARGGVDFWVVGEQFCMARRAKFLRNNSQRWISMFFVWEKELNARGREWYFSL